MRGQTSKVSQALRTNGDWANAIALSRDYRTLGSQFVSRSIAASMSAVAPAKEMRR